MSVVAMLAFNYYFLPPVGTLTVADPQNWVALFAFLVVAVHRQPSFDARAPAGRRTLPRAGAKSKNCTAFSQGLLESGNVMQLLNRIPAQIVDTFEVGAAALFLADKQKVYRSGPVVPQLDTESLKAIVAREEPVIDAANSVCFVPVRLGVRPIGSLGISGHDSFAPNAGSHRDVGRHRHGARARRRATWPDGSRAPGRAAAHRAARCRHACAAHAAHFDQSSVTNLLSNPALSERPEAASCSRSSTKKATA